MSPSNGERRNNESFHNKYSNASNEGFMMCGVEFEICLPLFEYETQTEYN